MNHLGHKSRAIHVAYAAAATVTVLPLEFYEAEKQKKIIQFDRQIDAAHPETESQAQKVHNG